MEERKEKIGDRGERIVRTILKAAQFSAQRNDALDHQKVDLSVLRQYGRLLPRPLEIQITHRRDAVKKMREYMAAAPIRAHAIRVYVEIVTKEMPREDIQRDLVNLMRGWATHPPETARFVRLSYDTSICSALDARVKRLEIFLDPQHPNRVDAVIIRLLQKEVEVKDTHGEIHRVPYGALQDPTLNQWLRICHQAGAMTASPLCGLSLILNQKDRDGHTIYAALRKPEAFHRLWPAHEHQLLAEGPKEQET